MKITCSNCQAENNSNAKFCSMCGYILPIIDIPDNNQNLDSPIAKKEKKKQPIGTIIGVVIGVLFSLFLTGNYFAPSIDSKLVDFSTNFNKNCPMNIDQFTRIDNTIVLPNKTIQYNYTIIGTSKENVDLTIFEETVFPRLLQTVKTIPDLKVFRDNEVTLKYNYNDESGTYVTSYSVMPSMYN